MLKTLFVIVLCSMAVSSIRASIIEGRIKDRLAELYPQDYKKYLFWFGLKLKFWYFRKKIVDGLIVDDSLLTNYNNIKPPLTAMYITWILLVALIIVMAF